MEISWNSPEILGAAFGIFVTLLFTLFPKLNVWFAAKAEDEKQQIMAALLIGFALLGGVLTCTGVLALFICTKNGIVEFILLILVPSVLTNQSVDRLVPKPAAVKAAKIAGKIARGEPV
jgi:hypothetical protein